MTTETGIKKLEYAVWFSHKKMSEMYQHIRHFLYVLMCMLLINSTTAEVRLVCPRPTTPRSDLSMSSAHEIRSTEFLGLTDNNDESDDFFTSIQPGLFTIRFEETKFSLGSPFRVILSERTVSLNETNENFTSSQNEGASCLLLDHIPHNDHAVLTKECVAKGQQYPLGVCNESTYYVTVRIPDIVCEDCLLVLQQVITNTDHSACDVTADNETDPCSVFVSTARIRIRPSALGLTRNLSYCANYMDNIPDQWPYRPEEMFQTDENDILVLDILHKSLKIEVLRDASKSRHPVEKVEVRFNSTILWNATVEEEHRNADSVIVTWANLSDNEIESLKENKFVLNIVSSKRSFATEISYTGSYFKEGHVKPLSDLYSEGGWLISHKSLGPMAEDHESALPSGPCAAEARYFVAFLRSVHVTAHGIIGITVIEDRAYIASVIHVDNEQVKKIRIMGPALYGAQTVEVDVPAYFDGIFQTSIKISDQEKYLYEDNAVHFWKSVEVDTDREITVLLGDLEESMFSVLRDDSGQIHGLGAFHFTEGNWLRVEVMMNNLSSEMVSTVLLAPETKLLDLSRESNHCNHKFCCLEAYVSEPTSDLILHVGLGHTVLVVTTTNETMTGQVSRRSDQACRKYHGNCLIYKMSKAYGEHMERRGWAVYVAALLDRANNLQFSVLADHVNWKQSDHKVSLKKHSQTLTSVSMQSLDGFCHTDIAKGVVHLQDKPSMLSVPLSSVQMLLSDSDGSLASLTLPRIFGDKCLHSKVFVAGATKHYWSPLSAPFDDILAVQSDNLKFIFDSNTTLFLMNSEEDFLNCNFTQASQLPPLHHHWSSHQITYFFTLSEMGAKYFADIGSCNSSAAAKLRVFVVKGSENIINNVKRDSHCRHSLSSVWRQRHLEKWPKHDHTCPIVVGMSSLFFIMIILCWQATRLHIFSETPHDSQWNSENISEINSEYTTDSALNAFQFRPLRE